MKSLKEYINIYEFLLKGHTNSIIHDCDDIPDEYKEISGNRVRVLGKTAVKSNGEETIWYKIWKYFSKNHDKRIKEAWKDLGFQEGYYVTTLADMRHKNMLIKGVNNCLQSVSPKYWKI